MVRRENTKQSSSRQGKCIKKNGIKIINEKKKYTNTLKRIEPLNKDLIKRIINTTVLQNLVIKILVSAVKERYSDSENMDFSNNHNLKYVLSDFIQNLLKYTKIENSFFDVIGDCFNINEMVENIGECNNSDTLSVINFSDQNLNGLFHFIENNYDQNYIDKINHLLNDKF